MKRVVILGSTGSIGENALRVVESLSGRFDVVGLAAGSRTDRLREQVQQFGVTHVAVGDPVAAEAFSGDAPAGVAVFAGPGGVAELVRAAGADIVVCALVGMAGLKPVLAAVEQGTDVALATKEVLVAAGSVVTAACRKSGARLLPVDSEHSAVFQCLQGTGTNAERGTRNAELRRIILTASGGPFGMSPEVDFEKVTIEQALNHPNWDMGQKVTIDSATLMNKGLEIMEARWLFDIPVEQIDVVIHPESIVHSIVEFVDGSMIAQLGVPDMRLAIQYALTYPDHVESGLPRLNLMDAGELHFRTPDADRFPSLGLARAAAKRGGTLPCVLNAANEVAVERFLDGRLTFPGIWERVEKVMAKHDVIDEPTLEQIEQTDQEARQRAQEL